MMTNCRLLRAAGPALVTVLALSFFVWGQATTSLRGVIVDQSGAAVTNAKVTLTNQATNLSRQAITSPTGAYDFVSVLPGIYKLTVEAPGFRTTLRDGLELQVNLPATANVRLEVGAVQETVEVSGEAPAVNTVDSSVGNTMGANAISNLPLPAENMTLLLSFQPGVVYNGENILTDSYDTRAGAVNGERSDQNNITLDGVSDNNEFTGYAFTGVLPVTQFSVQEFRVTTSNYDATQARSSGAQITMVTKGGTNQFHGSLYEFNRNTVGEANDWFLKQSQLASDQPNQPTKLVRNIFGGTIGGPVVKNRLFFFVNYEGQRQSQSVSVLRTIPSATLRDGIIQYECADPASCPGGNVTGVSGTSHAIAPGYYGISPTQLAGMDPLGIGPSTVALNYFQSYPMPNAPGGYNFPNYAAYRFAAPTKTSDNWYIARLDYNLTANGNHTLFLRGAARNDRSTDVPFVAGGKPMTSNVDLSKGLVAGYTAVFGPRWVNNFRYGITRQSLGTNGDSNQQWVEMRDLDQDIARTGSSVSPVHNFIDNVSWQKGSHTFQFGGNISLIRRKSLSDAHSYSDVLTNADWIKEGGFVGMHDPLDPTYGCDAAHPGPCYPAVSDYFIHAYDFPLAAMIGLGSEIDARYNYHVDSTTAGSPIAQGAPVTRHWATDTYSLYIQDTWRFRPSLTLTYGLNYQLMTPITETAGQQVAPSVNIGDWFNQRWGNMLNGIPSNQDTLISFAPAGSVYGKPGLYSAQTRNFAPRLGFAWTPRPSWSWLKRMVGDDKTVLHAGFGMHYDNFGPALAMSYDASGSFGLSTLLHNPAHKLTLIQAPRITSMNEIPTTDNSGNSLIPAAPASAFPVTYPVGAEAIANGIDQSLKTPYSYAANFSVERTLPGGMTLSLGYVGHFGHRLLVLDDVAMPLNLVDKKSGIDYFTAATRLSQLVRQGLATSSIDANAIGPTAQYWLNMLAMPAGETPTSLLQGTYQEFANNLYNETSGNYDIDVYGSPYAPVGGLNSFYNSQYSSWWAWRSIGHSNYNALQVSLKKQMSHGVLFTFNYTYSKSLDIGSQAERGIHYLTDSVINAWNPNQMYGPSDYDLRHQINAYWVAELPFGRGKLLGGNVARWADAFIGGWQLAGTGRWTSGYPFSVFMGYIWPTNWDEMGWANMTAPVATGTTMNDGTPNMFKDPTKAAASFDYAFPGQSGARDNVRGQGFFGVDLSLQKSWKIPRHENQSLQVRWNVYNATNSVRFNVQGVNDEVDTGSTFGNYSGTLTNPRVMEFSLIYSF